MNGILALVLCGIGWSSAGIFMKYIEASSFTIAGLRSLVAFFTLLILSRRLPCFVVRSSKGDLNSYESKENSGKSKNTKNPIDKKQTLNLWIAAISYSATMIMFCMANKMTYAANAVLLQYTEPIYIVLLSPFILGEKNSKVDYLCVVGVLGGMVLFFADSLFGNAGATSSRIIWGNIIAIISGVTFALTTMFMRRVDGEASKSGFMLAQIITFIFCIPFIIKNGLLDLRSVIFLILLGTIQMGLPNYLFAIGISKVRALSAVLIEMIEPLMNPIWVALFYHEVPTWTCLAGGVLILLFVVGNQVFQVFRSKQE